MSRGPIHAGSALFGAMLAVLTGCAHRASAKFPKPPRIGSTQTGIASWYGPPYHGRMAASGEIYDMEQLTAAHRTFPFGTWLEVTDLENGKKVDVRINDRGPFVRHRIIDLSLAAARDIDMVGPGTARVRLKVIRTPALAPASGPAPVPPAAPALAPTSTSAQKKGDEFYAVQAGAFSTAERADSFAAPLRGEFPETRVESSGTVWRVLIGRGLAIDDANRLAEKVRTATGQAIVVEDR